MRLQAEFHAAAKRALDADQSVVVGDGEAAVPLLLIAADPGPAEAVAAIGQFKLRDTANRLDAITFQPGSCADCVNAVPVEV